MTSDELATSLVRAACFLVAAMAIIWPFAAHGGVGVVSIVLAAPFILAGLSPRSLGPLIGKGMIFVATLVAFYDPPSSIAFFPERYLFALPFFVLALILTVPALPQALAGLMVKELGGASIPPVAR